MVLTIDSLRRARVNETVWKRMLQIAGSEREFQNKKVQDEINREFRHTLVTTSYREHRPYQIIKIDFTKSVYDEFDMRGKTVTYIQYYQQVYKLEVKPGQPLIEVISSRKDKNDAPIYLVPKFCVKCELPTSSKKDLPKVCSVSPQERTTEIRNLLTLISGGSKIHERLQAWGLKFLLNPSHPTLDLLTNQLYEDFSILKIVMKSKLWIVIVQ